LKKTNRKIGWLRTLDRVNGTKEKFQSPAEFYDANALFHAYLLQTWLLNHICCLLNFLI